MSARYATIDELAEATGLSDTWIRLRCQRGQIPGAHQPAGPGTAWRIERVAFWQWWEAGKRRQTPWRTSTSGARSGGRAPRSTVETAARALERRLGMRP